MASATLSARRDAGGGLLLVALEVGPELAQTYTTTGQYVEVTAPGASGFFVLASEPTAGTDARTWELLVRNAGDAADLLASRPLGSEVHVSRPLGVGIPIAGEDPMAIAVVGSALGLARPLMRRRIARGKASSTHLFIGLRAVADLSLRDEVAWWCESGAHVTLCLSRAELDHDPHILPQAERTVGYVQQAVATHLSVSPVASSPFTIVAAGPDAMLSDLRALPGADVLTNRG